MSRRTRISMGALIVVSIVLGACAKATPTVAPATIAAATATEPAPTDTPVPVPVDWQATWKDFLSSMPDNFYGIAPAALNSELQPGSAPVIIDLREPDEIARSGYIHGAENIPIRSLLQNLDMLPGLDQPIVVYDANGHRGAMAMAALRLLGYTNVFNLNGGFAASASLPVETGAPAAPAAGTIPTVDQARLVDLNTFLSTLPYSFDGLVDKDVLVMVTNKTPMTYLDVRTPAEVAITGAIPGATLISINDLVSDMSKLPADKNTAILVISMDGQNSAVASMALRMLGYSNANSLLGGIYAWLADKLPLPK